MATIEERELIKRLEVQDEEEKKKRRLIFFWWFISSLAILGALSGVTVPLMLNVVNKKATPPTGDINVGWDNDLPSGPLYFVNESGEHGDGAKFTSNPMEAVGYEPPQFNSNSLQYPVGTQFDVNKIDWNQTDDGTSGGYHIATFNGGEIYSLDSPYYQYYDPSWDEFSIDNVGFYREGNGGTPLKPRYWAVYRNFNWNPILPPSYQISGTSKHHVYTDATDPKTDPAIVAELEGLFDEKVPKNGPVTWEPEYEDMDGITMHKSNKEYKAFDKNNFDPASRTDWVDELDLMYSDGVDNTVPISIEDFNKEPYKLGDKIIIDGIEYTLIEK